MQVRVVVEKAVRGIRTGKPLQAMQWLLRQTQRDLVDGSLIRVRQTRRGHVDSDASRSRTGRIPEVVRRSQNPSTWLRRLPQFVSVERNYLPPVDFEHAPRQLGNRHRQLVVKVLGEVLDAVIDQGHQRRELVRRCPQPCFQDRDDPLA